MTDANPMTIENQQEFVTVTVSGQLFGLPVLMVRDIMGPQRLTRVPLARRDVAGVLNLRGRVVTAIDMRQRLSLPPRAEGESAMNVVVDHKAELYCLIVDQVGEVMQVDSRSYEANPLTLSREWREVCDGVYRLDGNLLAVLNVERFLEGRLAEAA
jgi:purine-binding chemotaxis protein CheW